MALISCPECGRMVSPNAEECPGCGAPIREMLADKQYDAEVNNASFSAETPYSESSEKVSNENGASLKSEDIMPKSPLNQKQSWRRVLIALLAIFAASGVYVVINKDKWLSSSESGITQNANETNGTSTYLPTDNLAQEVAAAEEIPVEDDPIAHLNKRDISLEEVEEEHGLDNNSFLEEAEVGLMRSKSGRLLPALEIFEIAIDENGGMYGRVTIRNDSPDTIQEIIIYYGLLTKGSILGKKKYVYADLYDHSNKSLYDGTGCSEYIGQCFFDILPGKTINIDMRSSPSKYVSNPSEVIGARIREFLVIYGNESEHHPAFPKNIRIKHL